MQAGLRAYHEALLARPDALRVVRAPVAGVKPSPGQPGAVSDYIRATPDVFIAVLGDGRVQAFNGHVDLGTGIRTALAQIVAEELDVALSRVDMVLGHTEAAPNQGPTIASASIQISAVPLRQAAALARECLRERAAAALGVDGGSLSIRDGEFQAADGRQISYWSLLQTQGGTLTLTDKVKLKPSSEYRVVGQAVARVDIPAKVTGALTYVHDMRVAGMLHGRVLRPPYGGRDAGEFVGNSLLSVDGSRLPEGVRVVVEGDFVAVVAEREELAIKAAKRLILHWKAIPPAPDLSNLGAALAAIPATRRPLLQEGEPQAMLADGVNAEYVWPFQMHASIGPSCALADWRDDGLTVWSGTQNPHMLRIDLHRLTGLDEGLIEVVRMEAAGCYGRNCADDVAGDAALLSRAVGAPVRVQLSREQEHVWEPKGAAQLMKVRGALDEAGNLLAYDFLTRYPSNDAPLLALLLTGRVPAGPRMLEMGDRTAVPPYRYRHSRIACDDVPAIVRAAWLRGVSALPNSFAHDCFVDEMAQRAGADPLEFRLRHLDDVRARELIEAVAARAAWQSHARGSRGVVDDRGFLHGRGVGYARYIHSKFPGFGAAWSAWVVDLTVHTESGRITVDRIVVGQDTGMMVNPDGVRHQIHGNVIQTLSRVLKERVEFDAKGVVSREWGGYPIIGFAELPEIDVVLMPRQDEPPMGGGESASVPGAAAIANAVFDATGLRWREPPFTPEKVRAGLDGSGI